MKKKELYKYPRNILIPVIFLIMGMLVLLIVYNLNVSKNTKAPTISSPVKMPLTTKADFLVEANVSLGENIKPKTSANFSGISKLNIDLANGKITLESLKLNAPKVIIKSQKINAKNISVTLNPEYPSTGEVNLENGEIDLSTDIIIEFSLSKNDSEHAQTKINMAIPFKGSLDKDSGVIKLVGEATIPPSKFPKPLPIKAEVIASTESDSNSNVSSENN